MSSVRFVDSAPVDYLARVAASEAGRTYKARSLAALAINEGSVVVDLGCGPATDLHDFAAATGPTGVVVGIDHDAVAVADAAASLTREPWVRVAVGDIHAVDLPDSYADRVHADRVLQHVANPAAVVGESRRILRPGGRVVFAEPDYDTLVLDSADDHIMRAYRSFVTERVVRNAVIGRQLPRLAHDAGFASVEAVAVTSVFTDAAQADELLGLNRVTDRAVAAGYIDAAAARGWLNTLATQRFFAALSLFLVVAHV